MSNQSKNKFLRGCCYIIFIVYFILLTKIILFKYSGLLSTFDRLITGELNGFRSYNMIPFQSICEFTKMMFNGYFSRGFHNIVGNILVFVPFGYFLPLLFKKWQNGKIVILAGFLVSLFFEICQYFLYLGSADIDDILLNLLGVILGYLFYQAMKKITYKKQTVLYIVTIILSIIGFIVAGYFAVDYFGIMFGIHNRKGQVNSSDDLSGDLIDDEQFLISSGPAFDDIQDAAFDDNSENVSENAVSDDTLDDNSDTQFDLWGHITSLDASGITINKTKIEDLGNGVGIASSSEENPDLHTVYTTEATIYTQKDIYDVNGDRVEIREAAREDLESDKYINIKGYQSDDKFIATEIIIHNFLFLE